jgi:hypothetical protein
MSPTTFQVQNIAEKNKCSCKIFFVIANETSQKLQVENEILVKNVNHV